MNRLLFMALMVIATPLAAQDVEDIGTLGLDAPGYSAVDEPAQSINESDLTQRVDDLTEAVNKHTEQIGDLDKRLSALEDAKTPSLAMSLGRGQLRSSLNSVGTVRSWGSSQNLSGGGCTGNIRRSVSSNRLLERIVSVSEPIVTSVQQGPPVVTSVQVSQPVVRYEAAPIVQPQPAPIVIQQPQIVQTRSMAMAPLPAAPAPVQRRDVVRMPVARVTTQNVRYEPLQGGDCPGGVCPVNRGTASVRRGGFLGTRLGNAWRSGR